MPLVGALSVNLSGSDDFIGSVTVNFGPSNVMAQTGLNYTSGSGAHKVGIVRFTHRPEVDGPETTVDFGSWTKWPPTIFGERVTSVTFGVAVGGDQYLKGYGNVFFWS